MSTIGLLSSQYSKLATQIKTHWNSALFALLAVGLCMQVFVWLWPAAPVYHYTADEGTQAGITALKSLAPAKQPDTGVYTQKAAVTTPSALLNAAITSLDDKSALNGQPSDVGPIAVNTASAQQLEALPGIGPKLAQRIVNYRQSHGRFGSLQALDAVKGVGPHLLAKIEPYLTF